MSIGIRKNTPPGRRQEYRFVAYLGENRVPLRPDQGAAALPRNDQDKLIIATENLVVGHALELLLHGEGYDTALLEGPPTNGAVESCSGARLLLFTPASSAGFRRRVLTAIGRIPALAGIPVLDLVSSPEGAEDEGEGLVVWPYRIGDIKCKIEASLRA